MINVKPLEKHPKSEGRSASASSSGDFDLDEPKNEIAVRLRDAIRGAGGNQAIALKSGVPLGTVNNYVRGVNEPKAAALGALAAACGVSLDWIILGVSGQSQSQSLAEPEFEGDGPHRIENPNVIARTRMVDEFAFLPRYETRASAGSGQLAVSEEVTDTLAFRREWLRRIGVNPTHAFLLQAEGDSMTPTIPDGALMLVDGSISLPSDIRNGFIYVLVRNNMVIVKRIQFRLDGSIVLISDNPIYDREVISQEDLDDFHVAGRVHWIGRTI